MLRFTPDAAGLRHSTGNQASSRLLSMRSANALLELPQGEGRPLAAVRAAVVTALLTSGDVTLHERMVRVSCSRL
jgi:hypothetical protein